MTVPTRCEVWLLREVKVWLSLTLFYGSIPIFQRESGVARKGELAARFS